MEQWCERGQHFSFMLVEIVSTLNIPNAEFVRNVSLNLSILTHPPCGFNKENSRKVPMKILPVLLLLILTETVAQRCSVKKVFLEILQNSQENSPKA